MMVLKANFISQFKNNNYFIISFMPLSLYHFCFSFQVYLVVDLDTGKEMAMKCVETGVLNPASNREVEVLKGEIQLYKTIQHERVVRYYGTAQDNKSISIFTGLTF